MHFVYQDKLSVIERVFLRKNTKKNVFFLLRHVEIFFFFFFFFFNIFNFNITYKGGRFYQKRSELDFRCESGRKGENRYPNWHYL